MMRQALRAKAPVRQQTSDTAAIPAPTRGWNARDPVAAMKPDDAVVMDNWIPRAGYVEIRRGSNAWLSGLSFPVESLIAYRGEGAEKLFAAAGTSIYDATTEGSAGPAVHTGLSNARLQSVNFANDGGAWAVAVNGADTPLKYDGSVWSTTSITGSSGSLTLDPTTLIDLMFHKRRLFLAEKDTLRVWFLGLNAISGATGLLDLGPVFSEGGSLAGMGTWTLDGGFGPDDFAVFLTTEGEVAVYQGTNPSDATAWALVGVFAVGRPLGRRALMKSGADLMVVTSTGVLPLSQAIRARREDQGELAITARIQNAWAESTRAYSGLFGWDALAYQRGQLAVFNIPTEELETSVQYVQNLQTGAWCRFLGLNAFCWEVLGERIFFGGATAVYQWDFGVTDDGQDVTFDLQQAFNYFGRRGSLKQFKMLQPIFRATADVTPAMEMLVDFAERAPTAIPTTTISSVDGLSVRQDWASVQGIGYCGSVRTQVKVSADPDLVSILVTGDGNTIITEAGGDAIATADLDSLNDSQIQIIGYNVLFEPGGVL